MSTSWNDTVRTGVDIRKSHIETLRVAVRNEISRRYLGTFTPQESTLMYAKAQHTQELIYQLSKINYQNINVSVGDIIYASSIVLLRNNVNRYERAPAVGGSPSGSGCMAGCTGLCSSCAGTCTRSDALHAHGCSGSCIGSCRGCTGSCSRSDARGCSGCRWSMLN